MFYSEITSLASKWPVRGREEFPLAPMDSPLGKPFKYKDLAQECQKTESVNGGISASLADDKKKFSAHPRRENTT